MPELRIIALVVGVLVACAVISELAAQRAWEECVARKVEVCE